MSGGLCFASIDDAAALFAAREVSPVELVTAVIERSEELNPLLGAYVETWYDEALAAARAAERRYADGSARPLEGIPFAVKDLHDYAGRRTTFGSRVFEDNVSDRTEIGLGRLLDAGAIPLARSAVPEFGISSVCDTPLWGVTRNPWNPRYGPCGSTSGGAAAVAAGMATFADASDYGGSIRGPASFCGLFGFKPPYGRNPMSAPGGLDPLATYGTVTRTVRDTLRTQQVLAGPDPRDPASLPGGAPPVELERAPSLRLAWSPDLGYFDVAEPVRANALAALETFEALGCVEEVELGWTLETLAAFEIHAASGFSAGVAAKVAARLDDVTPLIRLRYEFGRSLTGADAFRTLEVRARMWERLEQVFREHDVLLCPTGAVCELPAERSPLETATVRVGDRDVPAQNQAALAYPFNLLNQLPVASVPTGVSPSGVPTGLQIVGRPYADATVLALAAAFEARRPWLETRPDVLAQA